MSFMREERAAWSAVFGGEHRGGSAEKHLVPMVEPRRGEVKLRVV